MILNKLGPDEAISGAIRLYLDFINLFWFILRLLMELNRRN
jgi:FtsH-binding integral membrane protein